MVVVTMPLLLEGSPPGQSNVSIGVVGAAQLSPLLARLLHEFTASCDAEGLRMTLTHVMNERTLVLERVGDGWRCVAPRMCTFLECAAFVHAPGVRRLAHKVALQLPCRTSGGSAESASGVVLIGLPSVRSSDLVIRGPLSEDGGVLLRVTGERQLVLSSSPGGLEGEEGATVTLAPRRSPPGSASASLGGWDAPYLDLVSELREGAVAVVAVKGWGWDWSAGAEEGDASAGAPSLRLRSLVLFDERSGSTLELPWESVSKALGGFVGSRLEEEGAAGDMEEACRLLYASVPSKVTPALRVPWPVLGPRGSALPPHDESAFGGWMQESAVAAAVQGAGEEAHAAAEQPVPASPALAAKKAGRTLFGRLTSSNETTGVAPTATAAAVPMAAPGSAIASGETTPTSQPRSAVPSVIPGKWAKTEREVLAEAAAEAAASVGAEAHRAQALAAAVTALEKADWTAAPKAAAAHASEGEKTGAQAILAAVAALEKSTYSTPPAALATGGGGGEAAAPVLRDRSARVALASGNAPATAPEVAGAADNAATAPVDAAAAAKAVPTLAQALGLSILPYDVEIPALRALLADLSRAEVAGDKADEAVGLPPAFRSGYIRLVGTVSKRGHLLPSWRRRWFELDGPRVSYSVDLGLEDVGVPSLTAPGGPAEPGAEGEATAPAAAPGVMPGSPAVAKKWSWLRAGSTDVAAPTDSPAAAAVPIGEEGAAAPPLALSEILTLSSPLASSPLADLSASPTSPPLSPSSPTDGGFSRVRSGSIMEKGVRRLAQRAHLTVERGLAAGLEFRAGEGGRPSYGGAGEDEEEEDVEERIMDLDTGEELTIIREPAYTLLVPELMRTLAAASAQEASIGAARAGAAPSEAGPSLGPSMNMPEKPATCGTSKAQAVLTKLHRGRPRGSFVLSSTSQAWAVEIVGHNHSFCITTQDKARPFLCSAPSSASRDAWVAAINHNAGIRARFESTRTLYKAAAAAAVALQQKKA